MSPIKKQVIARGNAPQPSKAAGVIGSTNQNPSGISVTGNAVSQPTRPLVEVYPLKKEKIIKKTVSALFSWAIGLAIFGLILFMEISWILPIVLVLAVFGAFGYYLYQREYYYRYFYDLTPDGLVIGKGVFGSWKVTLPMQKVQDVYIDQDLFDRYFGLYDLHLSSATDISAREVHIDGVSKEDAEAIRMLIMERIAGPSVGPEEISKAYKPNSAGAISMMVGVGFGGIFIAIWLYSLLSEFGAMAFLALLAFPAMLLYGYLEFTALSYQLSKDGVIVRTGFLAPKKSIFLYRNIQDVNEQQEIIDRLLGIKTLVVKTMTSTSASAGERMSYLSLSDAQEMRAQILEQIKNAAQTPVAKPYDAKQGAIAQNAPLYAAAKKPSFDALMAPYVPDFVKAALYSTGVFIAAVSLLAVPVIAVAFMFNGWIGGVLLFIWAAVCAFSAAGAIIGALIQKMSYTYEVASEYVRIRIKFISLSEKQIRYEKIQDIERLVSFSDSFAGLASVRLETGSKEMMSSGQGRQMAVSMASATEIVPAIKFQDATGLVGIFARQMGMSLAGLGNNTLVSRFPLEKRKVLKKTISTGITIAVIYIVLLAVVLIVGGAYAWLSVPLTLIAVACIGVVYWYESEYYKKYFYAENKDVLEISKGVFGTRTIYVPFAKIQDVFIDRDWLDYLFGLYDLYISTATTRSILNAHIDGLDATKAQEVGQILLERIRESRD